MPLLTPELTSVIESISEEYVGDLMVLESAIGALLIGRIYGYRVLRLMHGSSAYSRYEKILGIKFKDVCPERTSLSRKSLSLRFADSVQDYWAVANGAVAGRGSQVDLT